MLLKTRKTKNCTNIRTYTLEDCQKAFLKYNNIRAIRNSEIHEDQMMYNRAKYHGWLDQCNGHMTRLQPVKYTYKTCKQAFLICRKVSEVQGAAQLWARKHGFLEEFTAHMIKPLVKSGTYTKEYLIELFLQFNRLNDLRITHNGAYQTAIKNGWLVELSSHMSGFGNISNPEEELRNYIKTFYPSACSKWFGPCKKGSFGKRFQLDIFIPELKLAVEFNGDYYHSYEVLKKSRQSWPDEMVRNYHQIKQDFFKELGIEYIEIWESEWKVDKQDCLKRTLEFLKGLS